MREKGATVHFIWVGPPSGKPRGNDVAGPLSIAKRASQSVQSSFMFWCLKEHQAAYQETFSNTNVTVCAIEDSLNDGSYFSCQVKELFELLLNSTDEKGYSRGNVRDRVTLKELFCFFLKHKRGGKIFDTTLLCSTTEETTEEIIHRRINTCKMAGLNKPGFKYPGDVWAAGAPEWDQDPEHAHKDAPWDIPEMLELLNNETDPVIISYLRTGIMLQRFMNEMRRVEERFRGLSDTSFDSDNIHHKHHADYMRDILHVVEETMLLTDERGENPNIKGLEFWETAFEGPYGCYPVLLTDPDLSDVLKDYNNTHGADRSEVSQIHRAAAKGDVEMLKHLLSTDRELIYKEITLQNGMKLTPYDMARHYWQDTATRFLSSYLRELQAENLSSLDDLIRQTSSTMMGLSSPLSVTDLTPRSSGQSSPHSSPLQKFVTGLPLEGMLAITLPPTIGRQLNRHHYFYPQPRPLEETVQPPPKGEDAVMRMFGFSNDAQ